MLVSALLKFLIICLCLCVLWVKSNGQCYLEILNHLSLALRFVSEVQWHDGLCTRGVEPRLPPCPWEPPPPPACAHCLPVSPTPLQGPALVQEQGGIAQILVSTGGARKGVCSVREDLHSLWKYPRAQVPMCPKEHEAEQQEKASDRLRRRPRREKAHIFLPAFWTRDPAVSFCTGPHRVCSYLWLSVITHGIAESRNLVSQMHVSSKQSPWWIFQ